MSILNWKRSSFTHISEFEDLIFECLSKKPKGEYVLLEGDEKRQVWTIVLDSEIEKDSPNETAKHITRTSLIPPIPMVLLHGMGAGVGLWVQNLEHFSSHRKVYAIDLPGFGKSFRKKHSEKLNAQDAEEEFISAVESWRKTMNLENFILLGHSLGGYLASAYALKHPKNVKGLILVDSWGFPKKCTEEEEKRPRLPLKWRVVKSIYETLNPNPLSMLRAAGPWGPSLVSKYRPDLIQKFKHKNMKDDSIIANYVYHCNAQQPSGEIAFKCMVEGLGWAKYPMIERIGHLPFSIPLTMINGRKSWVDYKICDEVKKVRMNGIVNIEIVDNAGHHVYADQPNLFNDIVEKTCLHYDKLHKFNCSDDNDTISVNDKEMKNDNAESIMNLIL